MIVGDTLIEQAVVGEDLLGGTLAFGAGPELGALGLVVLGAEDAAFYLDSAKRSRVINAYRITSSSRRACCWTVNPDGSV